MLFSARVYNLFTTGKAACTEELGVIVSQSYNFMHGGVLPGRTMTQTHSSVSVNTGYTNPQVLNRQGRHTRFNFNDLIIDHCYLLALF
jgi:hypothetical protein